MNVSVEVRLGELFTLLLVCPFVLFIVIVDGLDGHDFFPKLVAHKPCPADDSKDLIGHVNHNADCQILTPSIGLITHSDG